MVCGIEKWLTFKIMRTFKPSDYSNDPKNLEEAVNMIESKMKEEDREFLKTKSPDWFHGMNMRNNWNMWNKDSPLSIYFNSIGIYHPDDMYGTIMKCLKARIRNEPFDLNAQVQFYKDYWMAMEKAKGNVVITTHENGELKEISLEDGTKIFSFKG